MNTKINYRFAKQIAEDVGWNALSSEREPKYDGYSVRSLYVSMLDGVRIAVDIYLPQGLPSAARIPTLLNRTRYWRDVELRDGQPEPNLAVQFFTSYGYAIVCMDVRGTGASFGKMRFEWQPEDTQDAYTLVDWIIQQEWSNGKVGAYGVSYAGSTAELLAETCHPAITAIWASYFELDGYTDLAFPGGVPCDFVKMWGQFTAALDQNISLDDNFEPDPKVIGVKPVDDDQDRSLLQAAIQNHAQNCNADVLLQDVTYRDDLLGGAKVPNEEMAVYSRRTKIETSGVPIDIWGSWMDANTADTVIRHFATFKNPQRAVISAWSHGGSVLCSPFVASNSQLDLSVKNQLTEILGLMDQYFLGPNQDRIISENTLFYYTMGEEKWKVTTAWPPTGSTTKRLYFQEEHILGEDIPANTSGEDVYQVDFSASTGQQNRWWTEMGGGPVVYPDREQQDQKLLVYQSQPLVEDLEITGYPVINLLITSTENDGAFFVYVEDVDELGKVTYLTEGMLRALHRKVSVDEPPYKVFGPYHSYKRKDGALMVPGEATTLNFSLFPTSVLLRKGHKIRIAIGCADASVFGRMPVQGEVEIRLLRNKLNHSWVDLPIMPKSA
jgi:putative CocE/NonD family hydrolase